MPSSNKIERSSRSWTRLACCIVRYRVIETWKVACMHDGTCYNAVWTRPTPRLSPLEPINPKIGRARTNKLRAHGSNINFNYTKLKKTIILLGEGREDRRRDDKYPVDGTPVPGDGSRADGGSLSSSYPARFFNGKRGVYRKQRGVRPGWNGVVLKVAAGAINSSLVNDTTVPPAVFNIWLGNLAALSASS